MFQTTNQWFFDIGGEGLPDSHQIDASLRYQRKSGTIGGS